jgi:hypothetical protein
LPAGAVDDAPDHRKCGKWISADASKASGFGKAGSADASPPVTRH